MPKNPFQDWSLSSSPEGLPRVFAPLLRGDVTIDAWKPIEHTPVVSSTNCLAEARLSDGSLRVFKHLTGDNKTGGHWQASTDIEHPLYWRREAQFFESGVSRFETEFFRPVRCFAQASVEQGVSLELERVAGKPGTAWQESDYERAAHALGDWQRRLDSFPNESWLCRDWLKGYLALRSDHDRLIRDPDRWRIFGHFSAETQELVLRFLDQREALLRFLSKIPQLPAHNDFWPPNLFFVDSQLVVLDWSFPGMGPLASDLCTLAFDSIYDAFIAPADAMDFVHRLRDAYAEGMKIDPAELEKAIMAGLVVKYLWFFGHLLAQPDDGIDADLEPRMRAMQLVLAAGARLQRGLRT